MSMKEWAEKEIEIASKKDASSDDCSGYVNDCYTSALKAFNSLIDDGHSGMSIGITKNILMRLIDGKPLTAIDDIPSVWDKRVHSQKESYQCNRMSSLFKDVSDDGTVSYSDVNRYVCIDVNNDSSYTGGGASKIINEFYPITMPYYPTAKIKLYCEDFLVDKTMGDYDTKAYLYLVHPIDGRVEVNRFYKDVKESEEMVEISKEEYEYRKSNKL